MKFRILPLLIVICLFGFLIKIFDVVLNDININAINLAVAASGENKNGSSESKSDATPKVPPKKDITDPSRYQVSSEKPSNNITLDSSSLCPKADYEMFLKLKERREEIDLREKSLNDRENLLMMSEKRINEQLFELNNVKSKIQLLLDEYRDDQDQKIDSLVKIYSNMKPVDAARIFEELDMQTMLMVIGRMKEARAAPIIAQMNPAKARDLTMELANQSEFTRELCNCNLR